jgi:hypothetical protein
MLCLAIPAPAQAQQLSVDESAIALDVIDREPQGTNTSFGADVGRVFCFTRVVGSEGETTVHHVWYHGEEERADVELRVGGSSWRVWSSKAIVPEWTGQWRVEVQDAQGNVIETIQFTVR